MFIYYHNPRCSKSRQGLTLLEESNVEFKVFNYLEEPLSPGQLREVFKKLNKRPKDCVRPKESAYEEWSSKLNAEDDERWIQAICHDPILLERPILVGESEARIGRPPSTLEEMLK